MRAVQVSCAMLLAMGGGVASMRPLAVAGRSNLLPWPASAVLEEPPAGATAAPRTGIIRGRVVNLSLRGAGVASATVAAEPVDHRQRGQPVLEPASAITTRTGQDGAFLLTGLLPDATYRLAATYRGVAFPHAVDVPAGQPVATDAGVTLAVFEPDPEVPLDVRTAHIALAPVPEDAVVRVAEVWVVRNQTSRAWVYSPGRFALRLELPLGSIFLGAEAGGRGLPCRDGTVVDSMPFLPGERQTTITYLLPYDSPDLAIERRLPWPTAEMRLMVAWPSAVIESQVLTQTERLEVSDTTVGVALGRDLPAGATVLGVVHGLPPPRHSSTSWPPPVLGQTQLTGLALGIGGVASALALWYGWRHRARQATEGNAGPNAGREVEPRGG